MFLSDSCIQDLVWGNVWLVFPFVRSNFSWWLSLKCIPRALVRGVISLIVFIIFFSFFTFFSSFQNLVIRFDVHDSKVLEPIGNNGLCSRLESKNRIFDVSVSNSRWLSTSRYIYCIKLLLAFIFFKYFWKEVQLINREIILTQELISNIKQSGVRLFSNYVVDVTRYMSILVDSFRLKGESVNFVLLTSGLSLDDRRNET